MPSFLVQLVEFTVRYGVLTVDELHRMLRARTARGFRRGFYLGHWATWLTLGQLVGVLFLRSLDRAERIYLAMLARGYRGEWPGGYRGAPAPLDFVKALLVGSLPLLLIFLD